MYIYNAHVNAIYDGDTITVDIDLGFDCWLKNQKVRLYGLNAPEIRGVTHDQGVAARDALRSRILGKDIVIETIEDKKEKYGRWLAKVELNGENINKWLIANGFAVVYLDSGD